MYCGEVLWKRPVKSDSLIGQSRDIHFWKDLSEGCPSNQKSENDFCLIRKFCIFLLIVICNLIWLIPEGLCSAWWSAAGGRRTKMSRDREG